jgi:hypothetical protein
MPDVQEVFRMTTQKVRPDPGALERQFREQRQRQVRRKVAAYAAVAGVVVAGTLVGLRVLSEEPRSEVPASERQAPAVQGAPPTASDLRGVWVLESGPEDLSLMASFDAEGNFAFDDAGFVNDPAAFGSYRLDGRTITFINGLFTRSCPAGDRWAWHVGIPGEGQLHAVELDPAQVPDEVEGDCDVPGEYRWIRVSPASPAGASITAEAPPGAGDAPSTESALWGTWLLEGQGTLVTFNASDLYFLDDGGSRGPRDRDDGGVYAVDEEGTITFTSGPPSPSGPGPLSASRWCADGEVTTWREVRLDGDTLRATVTGDACAELPAGELTWIRLSP